MSTDIRRTDAQPYTPPPGWAAATSLEEELFLRRVDEHVAARATAAEERTRQAVAELRTTVDEQLHGFKTRWRKRFIVVLSFLGIANAAGAAAAWKWVAAKSKSVTDRVVVADSLLHKSQQLYDAMVRDRGDAAHVIGDAQKELSAVHAELASQVSTMNGLASTLSGAYTTAIAASQNGMQDAMQSVKLARADAESARAVARQLQGAVGQQLGAVNALRDSVRATTDTLRGQVQGVFTAVLREEHDQWQPIGLSGFDARVLGIYQGGRRVSLQLRERGAPGLAWRFDDLSYSVADSLRWACFRGENHRYRIGVLWGVKQHQSVSMVLRHSNEFPDLVQVMVAVQDREPARGSEEPRCRP